jgi:hypothetical protein
MLYFDLGMSYIEKCHLFGLPSTGIGSIKAGRTIQYLFKILIKQVVAKIWVGVDYHHCCEGFSPNMPN